LRSDHSMEMEKFTEWCFSDWSVNINDITDVTFEGESWSLTYPLIVRSLRKWLFASNVVHFGRDVD
jgi:hypothetical protein